MAYREIYRIKSYLNFNFSFYEILLNISFISLLLIIINIFYWEYINHNIVNKSRCKKNMDLANNSNGKYTIKATDKENNPLYEINYDLKKKRSTIDCSCNKGGYENNFKSINIRDLQKEENIKKDRVCYCNKKYNIGDNNERIEYNGDQGLIRYMQSDKYLNFFTKNTIQ